MTLRVADRAAGAITLVQGHLTHAPFRRAAFPLVAALSLLDVLPDPLDGLRRLDALVAPGGLLLLTCPYQWQADVTAPHLWWSSPEDTLRDTLRGRGYDIVEEDTALAWAVPSHARLVHVYALHALLARKRR
jgi:SAM-dependent methyltransferase